jgi:hypothetical protein
MKHGGKYRIRRWLGVCAVTVVCQCLPLQAQALDWAPTLMPPPEGQEFRKPDDAFRILIPASVPVEVLQTLRLELDGIDVTQFVTREGEYAVFKLPQALPWGQHELRVVEYAPNGNVLERANWPIQVRKTARFREADVQGNIDLAAFQRMMDDNLPQPTVGNSQGQGAAAFQGALANEDWRTTGQINFLYDTLSANDREVDMGEYLFTNQTPRTFLNVGHHPINSDSMILSGFNRRGVSGTLSSTDKRGNVTAFAMRTESITGLFHGLGVGNSDHRTSGVVGTYAPIKSDPQKLLLRAEYLEGKGQEAGVGQVGDPSLTLGSTVYDELIAGGDALTLVADGYMLEKKLRLRGEYARTDYDFDGVGTGFGKEDDHAYSVLAQYTPPGSTVGDKPFNWTVGVSAQQVGTYFKSIANPTLPSDKRLLSLFGAFNWGGLNVDAFLGQETDNVNDIAGLGSVRTNQFTTNIAYQPQPTADSKPGWAMFQNPYYALAVGHARSNQVDAPASTAAGVVDTETVDVFMSATFNPGTWNWGVSQAFSMFDDYADLAADTRDSLTSLNATFMLGERVTLSPVVQYDFLEDNDNNVDFKTTTAGLSAAVVFIPNKVNGSLNYSYNHIDATDNSIDTNTQTVDAEVAWIVVPAKANKPGLQLFVNGSWQDTEDDVTTLNSQDTYQVFGGIRVGLPVVY